MGYASIIEPLTRLGPIDRLWRKRRVFLAVFLAVVGAAVAALVVLPVRYLATASVIVAEQEPGVNNASPAWAQKIGDPADLESQLLVIRSARLLRQVMVTPGVIPAVVEECERSSSFGSAERCQKLSTDPTSFIEYVESRYSIASAGRSRVINISYQSALPDVAQRLANTLTNVFLDDQRSEGANSREVATTWLWKELKQLDGQLREADAKIQQFRRNKGLMRGATAPITSERLTTVGQQLAAAEAARAEALARLKEIKSEQERGPTDSPSVLSSRTIGDLKQQLTAVTAQLASANATLGPRHPSILTLTQEQASIQRRLVDEMKNIAASAQKTYDANDALVTSLKKQMDGAKSDAGSATLDEASIESMVRDTEIKRQQYAELYKKASELETERRVIIGSTRLVSLAELPNKPFFPKKIPFLAAGLTLGLILAIAAALLADKIYPAPQDGREAAKPAGDDRVAAPVNAQLSLRGQGRRREVAPVAHDGLSVLSMAGGVPILSRLPHLKRVYPSSVVGAILQDHLPLTVGEALDIAESNGRFRQSLANLMLGLRIGEGEPGRRIVVTSQGRAEGRTLTTLALANHAAAMGLRVLAVECDLQQPAFARALSIPAKAGLIDVLKGAISVRDAVVTTGNPKLDLLLAGGASTKAADQLARKNLSQLLSVFRSYDVVLIDSPLPSRQGRYFTGADSVLVCMKGDDALKGRATAAVAAVKALGASNVAIAATMAEPVRGTMRPVRPVRAAISARAV
jgi:polysaccharide biosynthesis transport protein